MKRSTVYPVCAHCKHWYRLHVHKNRKKDKCNNSFSADVGCCEYFLKRLLMSLSPGPAATLMWPKEPSQTCLPTEEQTDSASFLNILINMRPWVLSTMWLEEYVCVVNISVCISNPLNFPSTHHSTTRPLDYLQLIFWLNKANIKTTAQDEPVRQDWTHTHTKPLSLGFGLSVQYLRILKLNL